MLINANPPSSSRSRQAFGRRQWRHLMVALDVLMALLACSAATALLAPHPLSTFAATWFAAALAAWGLTRSPDTLLVVDLYSRAVLAPLIATALALLIACALRTPYSLHFVLWAGVIWSAGLLGVRAVMRRCGPRVRVGLLGCAPGPMSPSVRLQYVSVLPETFDAGALDLLVIDAQDSLSEAVRPLVTHSRLVNLPVLFTAQLDEELTGRVSTEFLYGQHLQPLQLQFDYLPVKRAFDLLGSVLLLPLLLPLLLIVAALVLLDGGGPVLFWQQRVGQHGRPFRLVKFRTMRVDSERLGSAFAQVGDPRVTRLGHVLRRFRLDELPQFYNILRGEMSLIGPRPEQLSFAADFVRDIPLYDLRHWVKPGLTGWAQVRQGYTASADETMVKLRYDVFYVKHFSPWLDLRILMRTALIVCSGFGAR